MKKAIAFIAFLLTGFLAHAQTREVSQSVLNNERFVATTNNVGTTVAVAGTLHHIFTFNNPNASGYKILIDKILFFASGTAPMIPTSSFIVVNPSALVTANYALPNNMFIGSTVGDGTTGIGYNFSSAALGGTQLPFELPTVNGSNILTVPIGLAPGNAFGIDLFKTVAVGAVNSGYFMIYYLKLPI